MKKNDKRSYLFLGFAIPDSEMEKDFKSDEFPQVQTHKFNWNLIKGLEATDEVNITYLSSRPVTDYPSFPLMKIKHSKWEVEVSDKVIHIEEMPFINVGMLKIISRFFSTLFYSFKNFIDKNNKFGVIVYSVHVPYLLTGLLLSKVFNIDFIAIWTDPPAVKTKRDYAIKYFLRNIEYKLSRYLMSKATKVIALTKYLATDFAPGKPYLVVEGIIDELEANVTFDEEVGGDKDITKVVYTGSLELRYGIKNIVEGFLLNDDDSIVLEIYGRGEYEKDLINISKLNKKINYKGFLTNEKILHIQREADFLINARSSKEEFVKYSFPSKTLEYMLSGTPLVTTLLPGIPEEYREYLIILDDNNPQTICDKLSELKGIERKKRMSLGKKALNFARGKNFLNQGKLIVDFIES